MTGGVSAFVVALLSVGLIAPAAYADDASETATTDSSVVTEAAPLTEEVAPEVVEPVAEEVPAEVVVVPDVPAEVAKAPAVQPDETVIKKVETTSEDPKVTPVGPALEVAPQTTDNTNSPAYWEDLYGDHQASCYKYEADSQYGSVTNGGKAVTLSTFDQSWAGDHWEVLIVKGGSVDNGDGPGNVVYEHPSAGVAYFAPLNAGERQSDVSHWIVCGGTTPAPEEPTCVLSPAFSYTFLPATGSGVITVTGGNQGDALCAPLYVRAASWKYDLPASGSPSWSQTQFGYNDTTVGTIGSFNYGPPQLDSCRQYDAYASFDGYSELTLPEKLLGSNNPYEPAFLHDVLEGMGPNPTFSYTSSDGCNNPPPLTPKVCTTLETGPTATDVNPAGWNSQGTRSTGVSEFVYGGYNLRTTDTDNPGSSLNKATLYKSITPTPLAEFGEPSVEFAADGSGVKPGMQVGVDVDGDGDWDGYLVGEPWSYGEHNWWVNKPNFNVPSGSGYTSFGSWADYVAANPAAKVIEIGLSMGSGVLGNWTVTSFTAGCVVYTFDKVRPVVVKPANPFFDTEEYCGKLRLYFTNFVELAEGETAKDAVYTYTDNAGVIQTVTVEANDAKYEEVVFPLNSGDHVVTVTTEGVEGSTEFIVKTDCEITSVTPETVIFRDGCLNNEDGVLVPGNLVQDSGIREDAELGGTYRVRTYDVENGTYYVTDTVIDGVRASVVDFVAGPGFVIKEPGEGDTYELILLTEDGAYATWSYTYSNEECATTPPVVEPPVVNPPVVNPPVDAPKVIPAGNPPVVDKLAYTGSDGSIFLLVAAFALVLVGAAAMMRRRIFGFMRFIVRSGRHSASA